MIITILTPTYNRGGGTEQVISVITEANHKRI